MRSEAPPRFKVMVGTGGAARCPDARGSEGGGRGGGGESGARARSRQRPLVNRRLARAQGPRPARRSGGSVARYLGVGGPAWEREGAGLPDGRRR